MGGPLFLHFLALTYIWRLLRFRESEGLNNSYPEGRNFSQVSFQWPLKLSLVTSTLSKQWWLTFCSVIWKGTKNDIHINVIFNRSHSIIFLSTRISFVHYRWLQITKAKREIPYSKISMMILKNQKGDFKDNTKKVQCSGGCHANIPDIRDIL